MKGFFYFSSPFFVSPREKNLNFFEDQKLVDNIDVHTFRGTLSYFLLKKKKNAEIKATFRRFLLLLLFNKCVFEFQRMKI